MEFQKIELYKERDFGRKINATVEFIRQNFTTLTKSIIYIAGPFILIISIINIYLQMSLINSPINEYNAIPIGLSSLLVSFVSFLAILMVITVVNAYIKIYEDKASNEIEVREVWKETKKYFLSNILAYIVITILIFIGFLFLVLPGIYLMVVFSLIFVIIVQEDKGFGDAFGRCFDLIRGKWWSTFGLLIVTGIIVFLISLTFTIPASILQSVVGLNSITNLEIQGDKTAYQIALIVITVIQNMASYILYSIVYVALAFQYGNLVERKEAVGLMDKIDNIGQSPVNEN